MRLRDLSVAILLLFVSQLAFASSSSPAPTGGMSVARDPVETAKMSYNDGLKYRDRAWKAEKELPTTQDADRRAKLEQIIKKSYDADIRSQRSALELNPNMFQAHTELAYALRKTGDYKAALESYDKALSIQPNYAEAIEYRAEAYLALNRIDDAQNAYLALFNGGDKDRSKLLGDAMQKWIEARKTDPAGATPESIDAMTKWVAQRSEIAQHTGTGSGGRQWK